MPHAGQKVALALWLFPHWWHVGTGFSCGIQMVCAIGIASTDSMEPRAGKFPLCVLPFLPVEPDRYSRQSLIMGSKSR